MKVSIEGTNWLFDGNVLDPGSPVEGLLTNVRMVNSVFEDDRETVPEILGRFESDANTDRFISRIPDYAAHGIAASRSASRAVPPITKARSIPHSTSTERCGADIWRGWLG